MDYKLPHTFLKIFLFSILALSCTSLFAQDIPDLIEIDIEDPDFPELDGNLYFDDEKNVVDQTQFGNNNNSEIYQNGMLNTIVSQQVGVENDLYFEQNGNEQNALISQNGVLNEIDAIINGENNELIVVQNGNHNKVNAEFHDIQDSEILLLQDGDFNEMDLYKVDENGMDLQISQIGSNMKLEVIEY